MNWSNFQTYDDAPTKAFEVLCNQLFENWCKEEYLSELSSFHVVNGAGGDGGVESYAVLADGKIIGLQAKWFLNSITINQMRQVRDSVLTALKIRPQITRYIICIPRDLSSLTGKSNNTEAMRWDDMKSEVLRNYPNLILELWNDTRLTQELQKDCSAGIFKFWFERAEISEDAVTFAFEKCKNSWLSTKYVPELNTFGTIHKFVCSYLGDVDQRRKLNELFSDMSDLCNAFYTTSKVLIEVCGESDPQLVALLNESTSQIQCMQCEVHKIQRWLENESIFGFSFDTDAFRVDFDSITAQLKESKKEYSHYFHFTAVIKVLQQLGKIRIRPILDQIKCATDQRNLVFLGEPGTGKTHGTAAEAERLLNDGYHIPILIQARDIPATDTWKDMLISTLGLANSWSEDEIWQGLSSLANRKKVHALDNSAHVSVLPKIIVFVDGVDESSLQDKWIEQVQETRAITHNYPSIRFCFMSRPYVFMGKNTGGRVVNLDITGDVPTYKLFDSYVKAYNVDASSAGWVKYALTTPLSLKLFCELNKGKTINYHSGADVSVAALLKEKIRLMEIEFCKQDSSATVADQRIFKSILMLANSFRCTSCIERSQIVISIEQLLSVDMAHAQMLASYLENYGILRPYCKHGSGLLSPDIYYYYSGIQGYFDYALALMLIDECKTPQNIDFNNCKNLSPTAFYTLAIVSIQKFAYLITDNESIDSCIDKSFKEELSFFSLRHTNPSDAKQYKPQLLQQMSDNAEKLKRITNKIILPLSREPWHPLGVPLLDEFLSEFEYPAQRDILWSVPGFLRDSDGEKWYSLSELALGRESYPLTASDAAEGLPTVYAWALSTVDNASRQTYRVEIMRWSRQVPDEFYKLFKKFSSVNDPQIRSDMFAVFMSLLFEDENIDLLNDAVKWLMENILAPDKIEENRDIAIRYYSTSIVRKAISLNIIDFETTAKYLPPFIPTSNDIELSKEALAGTYMGGFEGITYDLSRYVLIDHITGVFCDYRDEFKKQYEALISHIAKKGPEFAGISSAQLILSAAYQFITMCGWNNEFRYRKVGERTIRGVDWAISGSHLPKTHGSQSPVMTICEKYVWQARNYIMGFFADRLMIIDDDGGASYVDDYGMLGDFLIPALESGPIDPDSMNDLYPWHIPEKDVVIIPGASNSQADVKHAVEASPDITWKEWVQINNIQRQYPIDADELIALSGYSRFESPVGVETNLYLSAILVATSDVDSFISAFNENSELSCGIANPSDWKGACCANCYITPKEVCWMPWKKRYDSSNVDYFPESKIHSGVDKCTYNFIEYGDVYYELPSAPIRKMLKITDTDGYLFCDRDKQIKAANILAGENWETQQRYLLVDKNLLENVTQSGNTLLWIMREDRRENGKARERFGDFYAEKDRSYIGFFRNGEFVVIQIPACDVQNSGAWEADDLATDILHQYGYVDESCEQAE